MIDKYFLLFGLFFTLLISACNNQTKEKEISELQNQAPVSSTISPNTTLTSDENLIIKIKIPTAVCSSCEKTITKALQKMDGVEKAVVDAEIKIAEVEFNGAKITADEIRKAISNSGYDADDVKRNSSAYQKLDECCKTEIKSNN